MRLCYDATRFGFGLEEAVALAVGKAVPALEFTFEPFPVADEDDRKLSAGEETFLAQVRLLFDRHAVDPAVINLDYCLDAEDRASVRHFRHLVSKLAGVGRAIGCPRLGFWLESGGGDEKWRKAVEKALVPAVKECGKHGVRLMLRLSTPSMYRGKSLRCWQPMHPQDWRDLLSAVPELCLAFSPADCLWQGIDYLRILPGFISAVEHVEAIDVEVNQDMLKDSGLFGPLWWRYRLPGKGQIDWAQVVEALKLYGFTGSFSVHLDDEFVVSQPCDLERSLDAGLACLASLVKG
jgi:sugar phosphate isomerase/epimerase